MATGFRNLFISILLVGLFFFAMVNFGIQLSNENNANSSLLDHDSINRSFNQLSTTFSSAEDNATIQRKNFESEIPTQPEGVFVLLSLIKSGTSFLSTLVGIFNVLKILIFETLGISGIVLGVLSTILVISTIFLLWRVYKSGE